MLPIRLLLRTSDILEIFRRFERGINSHYAPIFSIPLYSKFMLIVDNLLRLLSGHNKEDAPLSPMRLYPKLTDKFSRSKSPAKGSSIDSILLEIQLLLTCTDMVDNYFKFLRGTNKLSAPYSLILLQFKLREIYFRLIRFFNGSKIPFAPSLDI